MFQWIQNHLGGAKSNRPRVGVDIGAQGLRVVCMHADSPLSLEAISRRQVPLPKGVINGAEMEDFEEVARQLRQVVEELNLQGCEAAFSFPSMAVRSCALEPKEYKQWLSRPDEVVIEYLLEKLNLPRGEWCFDWAPMANGHMCAVVARQETVMDRYALAEQAQLTPTVLDLERLATDRVFEWLCQQDGTWPQLWIRWCNGLLFAHIQIEPDRGDSAVRYCWQMSDLSSTLDALLDELSQVCGELPPDATSLAVRLSGLKDHTNGLMDGVVQRWPNAIHLGAPDQDVLNLLIEDDWSVALGLAMHPGLR